MELSLLYSPHNWIKAPTVLLYNFSLLHVASTLVYSSLSAIILYNQRYCELHSKLIFAMQFH